jgi:enediyne biosynthesis protein E7
MSALPPGIETPLSPLEVQRDALGFMKGLESEFGPAASYTVDGRQVVFLNRPEYATHVLQGRHRIYAKTGTPDMAMLEPMLGRGLLTTDGDEWLQMRRFTAPSFQASRVERFTELINRETERTLDGWAFRAAGGGSFEIGDDLTQLTTRIVARALFGADVSDLVRSFGMAVQMMNEFMGHYDANDTERFQRFFAARAMIDGVVRSMIEARMDGRTAADPDAPDFLASLLETRDEEGRGLSAESVRDQVMTLLMAGHETTAKVLTWTLYLLDQHPAIAEALRAEVATLPPGGTIGPAELAAQPLAWRVLQESMRLYPPVWILSRTALEDDVVGEWAIPQGTLVLISPYMLHRRAEDWPDPDAFRPDRFTEDASKGRHPGSFIPFSAGPRLCIGKHMARLELHIALLLILERFRVRVDPSVPVLPEALVTLRPKHGLHATLESTSTPAS